jgi:hypothetical protein
VASNLFDWLLKVNYASRADLTARVSKECFDEFNKEGQQYNVMVFNLEQSFGNELKGVIHYQVIPYADIAYGVWVFEEGEFVNHGDGGNINWAFKGWFDRDGRYVKFRRP